jgi:TolA-binding protein
MPWYVLLIVALVCIAFVLGVLVSVALKGLRVGKHAAAVSGRVTPLVDELSRRGDEITRAAGHLSADAEQLNASIKRMQGSIARLQVIAANVNTALRPLYVISGWLSGEREWGDLGY